MKIIVCSFLCLISVQPLIAKDNAIARMDDFTTLKDTLPTPPANVRCGDGKNGYGLYWIDKSNNEDQFKVYRAINKTEGPVLYVKIKSTSSATQGTDYFCKIDYVPENYYTYAVTSVNKTGESGSSNVTILPKQPAGFTGIADSVSVILHWTYPMDSWITFLFVERSTSPDSGFQIMSPIVSQKGVSYFDYSAEKGVDYYYRIKGAFYDSKTRVTSYTIPSTTLGPFRISVAGKGYDGEINYQGRNYKYKTFGSQTWMIENLAWLPEVYPSGSVSDSIKRYYVYGYQGSVVSEAMKTDNYNRYGVLYNLPAASEGITISSSDTIGMQGICPAGWHLPSNSEWMALPGNLEMAKASRDSAFHADAIRKNIGTDSLQRYAIDIALPVFKKFDPHPGGYVHGDSIKFLAIGEVENYWSATNRIVYERIFHTSDSVRRFGYPVRCLKGAALPMVRTTDIIDIAKTTASPGGNVTADGGTPVTDRGVCWSTIEIPSLSSTKTSGGTGTGVFNCSIAGLASGTIYFIRAYATNSVGTTFGEPKQFISAGKGALPSVETREVAAVLGTSAAVGGSITSFGGAPVTARGVCWNTKKTPVISNNIAAVESDRIVFTGYLAGLNEHTIYYVRAYATNSYGTSYGPEKQFTTTEVPKDDFFDYNGQKYNYKTIGAQTWMTENLAWLPAVSPTAAESYEKPMYYVYGYEGSLVDSAKAAANYKAYGVLYNWSAATKACPSGWHLPGMAEMTTLIDYLTNYGYGFRGSGNTIAKSMAAASGWAASPMPGTIGEDLAGNNRSGFNALPAGQRTVSRTQKANDIGKIAILWLSSTYGREDKYAYSLALFYSNNIVQPYPTDKKQGFSVRCLKDK